MRAHHGPDHEAFKRELALARLDEDYVIAQLIEEGLPARADERTVAETPWEASGYVNERDVVVADRYVIEVRSRTFRFTCAQDYPYPTAYVCAVKRWQQRVPPYAFVIMSRPSKALLALSPRTYPHWHPVAVADSRRDGWTTMQYEVSISHLVPFSKLVRVLRKKLGVERPSKSLEQLQAEAKGRRRQLFIREEALWRNHLNGYIAPGRSKQQFYEPPSEYAALKQEFAAEVGDEEIDASPWRWHS